MALPAPKLLTDAQLFQMTGSWTEAARLRDQQNQAMAIYNDAQRLYTASGAAPATQASAVAGVVDPTQVGQYVQDPATGKYVALSSYSAGFDPNNPITQTYLGELAARGGQNSTSQAFINAGASQAQQDANASAWATELARLQEIDRQNALQAAQTAQQVQQTPTGLLDVGGRQASEASQSQAAKVYSPAEVAAYNAYRAGDIAGVNRAVQAGNLTKAQVQSSFGLSDADMNWMANNAGVKFFTPTTTTVAGGTTGGTTVGNKTYTQAETDLYNAYRAGDIATVNRLLAANKWTGADIKSKFGLTDADISWITNNAGGKFYSPTGTVTETGTGTGTGTGVTGGQTPAGQFRELFPSFAESKRLATQAIAARPTTQSIVNMISNPQNPALTSAWQAAEKSGNYGDVAGMLQNMPLGKVQSAYGLSNADMQYIMSRPEIATALSNSGMVATPAPTLTNVLGMISK